MFKNTINYTRRFFVAGNERSLNIKKNVLYSFLLKGASVGISLIIIPLTINYINPTQYGVWLTLSAIISWFSFFDIGLGNGLKNKLAESNALGKYNEAKIYISTTYAIITIISAAIFLLFFIFNRYINWSKILNVPSGDNLDLQFDALIVIGCFCIQFVVQLINVVLTACHVPAKVTLITFIGQVISLILIFILTKTTTGHLTY